MSIKIEENYHDKMKAIEKKTEVRISGGGRVEEEEEDNAEDYQFNKALQSPGLLSNLKVVRG